jgi:acyl-CoA thioesterase YciA
MKNNEKLMPPSWEPSLRMIAMPKDTNANGNIFGGWLVSLMDMAAGSAAWQRAKGPAVTVAIEKMEFHQPVLVGDEVSCYTHVERVGRTSLTIKVESWVRKRFSIDDWAKVTQGTFVFVAIDENHKPRTIPAL